ncbi:toll/interleukin-1 receptor domain-containing protein [Duncaniella dubosii]|uniref:toll/interleukin-1 receptor domain-containing protein n=1 Tax=Duncaniella dubosii TaxID=2518971 RepID=UPI003F669B2F
MSELNTPPKVFISYSWSPEQNKDKAKELAERLFSDGIHVIMDIWDLQEGQDKYAFMERMVNDETINKVLLLCNSTYTYKANKRSGGAGTEGMIISSELYNHTEQTKFIPIIFERDSNGNEIMPTFVNSRIYIDLSDNPYSESEYEKLIRCIYGKPENRRPSLGTMPAYLNDEKPVHHSTTGKLTRLSYLIEKDSPAVKREIKQYIRCFLDDLAKYKIDDSTAHQDNIVEDVERNIASMEVLRKEFIRFLETILYTPYLDADLIIDFWQSLMQWYRKHNIDLAEGNHLSSYIWDHFRNFNKVLFLSVTAFLIKNELFHILHKMVTAKYIVPADNIFSMTYAYSFVEFRKYNYTLNELKKKRDHLNLYNIEASIIRQNTGDEHEELMKADILLYYLSIIFPQENLFGEIWYPTLAVFNRNKEILPMLISKRYFEKAKHLFGVKTLKEYKELLTSVKEEPINRMQSGQIVPTIKNALLHDKIAIYD